MLISNTFPEHLSKEEEAKLLEIYSEGSAAEKKKAKDELIAHNLRLVAHIAKKYAIKDNEDIISIGTIGLIAGLEKSP